MGTTSESTEDSTATKPVKQKHKAKRSETKQLQLDMVNSEKQEQLSKEEEEAEKKQIALLDEAEKVLIEAATMAKQKEMTKTSGSDMPPELKGTASVDQNQLVGEKTKQITGESTNENRAEVDKKKQGRLPTFLEKTKAGEDLAEKAAIEKANAGKEAKEKAASEKKESEKAAAEKAAKEKASAEQAAAENTTIEKTAKSMTTFVPGYIERDSSLENFEELEVVQELIKEGEKDISHVDGKDPITLIPVRKADYDERKMEEERSTAERAAAEKAAAERAAAEKAAAAEQAAAKRAQEE